MKKIISFLLICLAMNAKGQSTTLCLSPNCKQVATTADSVQVLAMISATSGMFGALTWSEVSGPAVTIPAIGIAVISTTAQYSGFTLRNLSAGTYVFQAILGTTGLSVRDTVTITQVPRRIAYTITVWTDSSRVMNQ